MAKVLSSRLANPETDPLPIGPTVFSRRKSSASTKSSQSDTGGATPGPSLSKATTSDSASSNPKHRGTEQEVRVMNSHEEAVQRATREHLERASREKKS